MLKPIFENLAEKEDLSNVVFIAADANEHPQASQYQVSSVPTLLFFKGSEVLGQNVGFVPEQQLSEFLKKLEKEELSN
jgi:thioredoxin 1